MSQSLYFTIASANYLPYVRTLHASLRAAGIDAPFHCVLSDEVSGRFAAEDLGFPIVEARALGIPTVFDMAFRYSVVEFNTAVKAGAFRHFFRESPARDIVFLDPDILVLRPLADVHRALEDGNEAVLTPHIAEPLADGRHPDELTFLLTGTFNLGFAAFRRSAKVDAFLAWWADRLRDKCVVDLEAGLFVDQKLMNLAPAFLERVAMLRHPGYNTAYWNLAARPLAHDAAGGWTAAGEPLHFFHFSGVVPGDRSVFSKHQNRFAPADLGAGRALLQDYLARLEDNRRLGNVDLPALAYAYARLGDGTPVTPEMRRIYARHNAPRPARREDVFVADLALYNAPDTDRVPQGEPVLTRLMAEIWRARADLREAFPLTIADRRLAYFRWFVSQAASEHDVPRACLAPARAALARAERPAAPSTLLAEAPMDEVLREAGRILLYRLPRRSGRLAKRSWRKLNRALGRTVTAPATRLSSDVDRTRSLGVDLVGYLRSESGVGEGARRAHLALQAAGMPVRPVGLVSGAHQDAIAQAEDDGTAGGRHLFALLHVNADETPALPARLGLGPLEGHYRIGYWAWELSRFPAAWRGALDLVHEVWCPSGFTAATVRALTEKPVAVMPHAIPPHAGERARGRARAGLPPDGFVFLAAFDTNSYLARKNPLAAIRAFLAAFPDRGADAPRLVLKAHGRLGRGAAFDEIARLAAGDPRLHLIDTVLDAGGVADLQAACDCFVSLHRAEGFGLNLAECMAAGKPVIATAYSGNMEFMTDANSLPVAYTLRAVGPDEYPQPEGQFWAEPDHDAAVAAMRRIVEDPALREEIGAAARATMREGYSLAAAGRRMRARLEAVLASIHPKPEGAAPFRAGRAAIDLVD